MVITSQRLRWVVAVVAAVAPQRVKHLLYRRLFGWDIHPTAHFGYSLILVDHLCAAEGVSVSHLNVIKGCDEVKLGVRAFIGALNWITSPPRSAGFFPHAPNRRPRFELGDEAGVSTRHAVYCVDEVVIEPYAILGGIRSVIITNAPDYEMGRQRTAPVRIGHHSIVGTCCTLLAGSSVPPRCIVGGGAVVSGPLAEELAIYGGVPARKIKALPEDSRLLHRELGRFY